MKFLSKPSRRTHFHEIEIITSFRRVKVKTKKKSQRQSFVRSISRSVSHPVNQSVIQSVERTAQVLKSLLHCERLTFAKANIV